LNKPTTAEIGVAVRQLVREGRSGALATVAAKDGSPLNALVTYATDGTGQPIFSLSTLSDHTRNILSDPRASLLVEATSRRRNPQTGPRVALVGVVRISKNPTHRARFLARHPDAAFYAGFGDFAIYRMTVEKAHYIGGFARAHWIKGIDAVLPKSPATELADMEADVIAHMNLDHAKAIDLYANVMLGRKGSGWQMTGLDAEGCDLRCAGRSARLWFPEPLKGAADVRPMLVDLAKTARA